MNDRSQVIKKTRGTVPPSMILIAQKVPGHLCMHHTKSTLYPASCPNCLNDIASNLHASKVLITEGALAEINFLLQKGFAAATAEKK